jgi:hypothetical protein
MGCAGPACPGVTMCCPWTDAGALVKIQKSAAKSASTVRTRRKFPPKNAEQERTRCKVLNHNTEAESLNCLSGLQHTTGHAMRLKAEGLHPRATGMRVVGQSDPSPKRPHPSQRALPSLVPSSVRAGRVNRVGHSKGRKSRLSRGRCACWCAQHRRSPGSC